MTTIITNQFQNFKVKALLIDNEIHFIAKEISSILGYSETNKMLRRIDDEDKITISRNGRPNIPKEIFGNQGSIILLNESGLYNAIFGSKLSIAKHFKRWVTSEVLPEIRKTGSYSLDNSKTPKTFDIKSYTQQNRELIDLIKLITSENAITLYYLDKLTQTLNLQSPIDLLKIDLTSHYFIPTELGKVLNKSAVEVNKILEKKGLQTKINGTWQLTEKGKKFGIKVENSTFVQLKWNIGAIA